MNHLFVGAVFPFLIGLIAYAVRRGHASLRLLILTPFGMAACATWAVLPDLPRTFGLAEFDARISMNPVIDVFFWHYTLNLHESYSPWFNIGFVAMVAALFWAAWRELRRVENESSTDGGAAVPPELGNSDYSESSGGSAASRTPTPSLLAGEGRGEG